VNPLFLKAVFLQYSEIVGAGIFVLPILFANNNPLLTIGYLLLIAVFVYLINYLYITVILKTKGDHQLAGYADLYLGSIGKIIALLSLCLLGLGALAVYIQLGAQFFSTVISNISVSFSKIIFVLLISLFHLLLQKFAKSRIHFLSLIYLLITVFIAVYSLNYTPIHFQNPIDPSLFGALIFSLTGFAILPEVEETLRLTKNKSFHLKTSSLLGVLLAVLTYALFSFSVVRIAGPNLTENALTSLGRSSPLIITLLCLFGFVATFKASLNFLNIFKEILYRDLKIPEKKSYIFSTAIILVPYLLTAIPVLSVVSFTGEITLTMVAILIVSIFLRLSK
jgi:amino acid permease